MPLRGKLIEDDEGLLSIWREPETNEDYVMACDSSEGVRGGDLSAACVLRQSDRALCAVVHGLVEPVHYGRLCARVGWHYNEALLAFETYPSAHGHSAAREALRYGYARIYTRVATGKPIPELTDDLGWRTMQKEKEMMVDAVRVALEEEYEILSLPLLRELQHLKYDQRGKIVTAAGEHDDLFDAYAIALCVADEAHLRGEVRKPKNQAKCIEDEIVERWERLPDRSSHPQETEPLYDGN